MIMPSTQYRAALSRIVAEVSEESGVPVEDILGIARHQPIVWARHHAIARAYRETGAVMTQIGQFFGRDHTSIINAIRRDAERNGAN